MKTNILKITMTALAAVIISSVAFGQFTVRAWGGYGIESGKSQLPAYAQNDMFAFFIIGDGIDQPLYTNLAELNGDVVGEVLNGSYGAGANAGLAVGYQFTEFIGAELGASFLFGKDIESGGDLSVLGVEDYKNVSSTNMFFLKPAITFTAPFEKVRPYARVGATIGLVSTVKSEMTMVIGVSDIIYKDEVSGGTPVGITAAAGIDVPVSDVISIFGEAEYNAVRYTPDTREVTEFTSDGVDGLPIFYANGTKHKLTDSALIIYNPFAETTRKKGSYALSSLSFNLGIKLAFGGSSGPRGR